jgi:hypothetical protein
MDKLTEYPALIKKILTEYIELCNRTSQPGIETFLIVDESKGHYIWMNLGWQNEERLAGMTVYVRLCNGQFWIEEDWTEEGIARILSLPFMSLSCGSILILQWLLSLGSDQDKFMGMG